MSFLTKQETKSGIVVHVACIDTYALNPEKYGGKPTNRSETEEERIQRKKEAEEKLQNIEEEKSVYVKGFSMPFGEMVVFMVKWVIASIPAFIILFIIFGILFGIFGALFF